MTQAEAGAKPKDDWGPLSALPGNPLMWVLIGSELAVFGVALIGYAGARARDPAAFAADQDQLNRLAGLINTAVLLTSGLFAALANVASHEGRREARALLARSRRRRSASSSSPSRRVEYARRTRRRTRSSTPALLHPLFPRHRLPRPACRAGPRDPRHSSRIFDRPTKSRPEPPSGTWSIWSGFWSSPAFICCGDGMSDDA